MARQFTFLFVTLFVFTNLFSQTNNSDTSKTLKLVKATKIKSKDSSDVVFKSNSGFVKIYKLNDSLFLLKAYDNKIYLAKTSIIELQEAAKLLKDASKGDKVNLNTFRCDITKGKILGADTYWFQLYKQKTRVDLSNLSYSEIYALSKSSNATVVKNDKGQIIIEKANVIEYEEMVERFGITNKELNKIFDIK